MRFNKEIIEFRKKFFTLMDKADKLKNGIHDIQVAKVFAVGFYMFSMPEVAVIRDNYGRVLAIPEDNSNHLNSLVSRWDIRKGKKLQLIVKENQIKQVFQK